MNTRNDETLQLYVEESLEHLAHIENDFLAIEKAGKEMDEERVNKVFRAAHSIKGGAAFMGLGKIKELAHKMENVLGMIRSGELIPDAENINILLLASDALRNLLENAGALEKMDISDSMEGLSSIENGAGAFAANEGPSKSEMVHISIPSAEVRFQEKKGVFEALQKDGRFIYVARINEKGDKESVAHDRSKRLERIQKAGMLLNSAIEKQPADGRENASAPPLWILFSCVLEPEDIPLLLETAPENIFVLHADMTIEPLLPSEELFGTRPAITSFSSATEPADRKTAGSPEQKKKETGLEPQDGRSTAGTERTDISLRVRLPLLDSLMSLAGELVLSRNQLLQRLSFADMRAIEMVGQRISLITSELQETVMATRMQPIGSVFNKFPRLVRDLARTLGKNVELTLEGQDVELDRTILESISDPLTHLVRNSVDHGIEDPSERKRAGKDSTGKIHLRAYHEAGQVNIEVADDGRGLDGEKVAQAAFSRGLINEEQIRMMTDREKVNLIFLPGFSLSSKVTDLSGRGVGMDVVKTNLDRLGGQVEINAQPGKRTVIRIRLPLTLAIIPSLIIMAGGERFAIPQVNLVELLRVPAKQVKERIEKVGDAEVVRLRGKLLPLVKLTDVLGITNTFFHPEKKRFLVDQRKNIADRRSLKTPFFGDDAPDMDGEKMEEKAFSVGIEAARIPSEVCAAKGAAGRAEGKDRRYRASSALNIAVVSTGVLKYGMVVDRLLDSEEIVVKPLGRHLQKCRAYAGATILGDGHVVLILDVANIAQLSGLTSVDISRRSEELEEEKRRISKAKDTLPLLLFKGDPTEHFGLPLNQVVRIEKVRPTAFEEVGGNRFVQYRGRNLPLVSLEEVARVRPVPLKEELLAIVFAFQGREVGLLGDAPVDAVEAAMEAYDDTLKQTGIMGSLIIDGHTTMLVDLHGLIQALRPEWLTEKETVGPLMKRNGKILLVEDSTFFRNQVKECIENAHYAVLEAADGLAAWEMLEQSGKDIDLVLTDIEMPRLDGLELTRRIRRDKRFQHLPVIALTTLASDREVARGREAGVDNYLIKLDREKLMHSVDHLLNYGRDTSKVNREWFD